MIKYVISTHVDKMLCPAAISIISPPPSRDPLRLKPQLSPIHHHHHHHQARNTRETPAINSRVSFKLHCIRARTLRPKLISWLALAQAALLRLPCGKPPKSDHLSYARTAPISGVCARAPADIYPMRTCALVRLAWRVRLNNGPPRCGVHRHTTRGRSV